VSGRMCKCKAFGVMVERGVIKEATHQVMSESTGKLRHIRYFFIGPKSIRRCVIFPYCPVCGGLVKVNRDFYADTDIFPPAAEAQS